MKYSLKRKKKKNSSSSSYGRKSSSGKVPQRKSMPRDRKPPKK